LTRIQEKLDDAEFAESWEQERTLDEAVALTLGEVEPDT
jgi:hypothetical protein